MTKSSNPARNPLRVGIGGPVGSGKTALCELLCKKMRDDYDMAVTTNDIYTKDQGVPGQSSNQSETAHIDVWRDVATLRAEKKNFPWSSTDVALQLAYTFDQERFTDLQGDGSPGEQ